MFKGNGKENKQANNVQFKLTVSFCCYCKIFVEENETILNKIDFG